MRFGTRGSASSLLVLTTLCLAGFAGAQGFPNVAQTPGTLLSGLNAPQQGRTAILAYHNGLLFTVPELPSSQPDSDFLVRTWDISDPTQPVELTDYGVSPQPINAHGYFKSGEYLILGPNWPPEAPWSFQTTPTFGTVTRTEFPGLQGAGVRGQLFQPWYVGQTWWSYGEIDGLATIEKDFQQLAEWDHLGLTGVVGHPFLLGDLLIFASDQSRTGVATYDVSDPTNPVLLDVLTDGGPGGYWPELWGGEGKLYVVFPYRTGGNGFRVADITDPTDLRFITDRPLPGDESMYIQFQDEYAFMGGHKVDMRSFESVLFLDGENAVRTNDGGIGVNTSQFLLPLGNLLVTGGIGPNQGMAIWAHQATPDTRGPSVGYHVPRAGRTNYPVGAPISLLIHETLETSTLVNGVSFIVRPLGGSAIPGRLIYSFNDILTFTPDNPLQANTTYEVLLPAGGIEDAAGNGMVEYSFTFSTGASVGGNQPPEISAFTASLYPAAPAQNVTLNASASDPDTDPVEYRFDFGDGSPSTAWSSTASAQHAYSEAGHYQATVQVRDPSGSLRSQATTVTVTTAPAGPFPTGGGPILCDDGGRQVWSVNPDNDTVTALSADTNAVLFEVPVCDEPRGIARSAAGELWVTCHGDDRIRILDASGTVQDEISTGYGSAPAALAFSPDGATAYLTLEGAGELRRYNATTRAQTGILALGPRPRAVAVTGDGAHVLVTRFLSARDHGEVWEVETTGFTLSRTLRIPKFGDEENRDTTASGRGVANYLVGLAIAPDDGSAWVTATKVNDERGVFFALDLDSDNTVRSVLVELDLTTGEAVRAIDIDNSDSPSAVTFSPLGDYLFVSLQGDNTTVVLDALALEGTTGLGSFVTRLGTGQAPQGLCLDPTTEQLFVKNFMGRSVSALETTDLLRFGTRSVPGSEVATVLGADALSPTVLNGKRIFYDASDPRMSAEGYLSCATCHLDGGHDGRVWDFTGRGEGFRNTTSLRGRSGLGHGKVHWSANFDEIQDFENDMRNGFGGLGFLDDADFTTTQEPLGPAKAGLDPDLDALAAYVASLGRESLPRSPFRMTDDSFTPEAVSGRDVFRSLGCNDCHGGDDFTNSPLPGLDLRDVGTLRTSSGGRLGGALPGIDMPTLLGVWNTAPYFHDGSAATLEDVFTVAGGTLLQAEDGTPTGGSSVTDQYVDLNNDDTAHDRAFVGYAGGGGLTLSGVDGGIGGLGAIEVRYSSGYLTHDLEVRVNGALQGTLVLPETGNDPQWRHTVWRKVRLENVNFAPGTANTVELNVVQGSPNLSLDDVLITNASDLARAEPHRTALTLSASDRDALLAYLRQLDGTPESNPNPTLFSDGFESGDVTAWATSTN